MEPQSDSHANAQVAESWIKEQIERNGPVTVAQFISWALYHPNFGYYTLGPNIGPRGDFTTSPEASPAFGRLLARHLEDIDELLDHPTPFHAVEYGPGRGTLASDLLDTLHADDENLYRRLRYHLVDVSPALTATQRDRLLPRHSPVVTWASSTEELPVGLQGAVIANELVDAFPVHVLENRGGTILEQYVTLNQEGNLALTYLAPSDPDLATFLDEEPILLEAGERIEVNLAVKGWLAGLSAVLERGAVTIVDYGDEAPQRYSPARREGTLLGYHAGSVTDNFLAHPGEQDLTALVDFTALQRAARASGFTVLGMTRQANFLLGLGLGTTVTPESETNSLEAALQYRRGLQALISMEGLGRFHVLLLGKQISSEQASSLSGLRYSSV